MNLPDWRSVPLDQPPQRYPLRNGHPNWQPLHAALGSSPASAGGGLFWSSSPKSSGDWSREGLWRESTPQLVRVDGEAVTPLPAPGAPLLALVDRPEGPLAVDWSGGIHTLEGEVWQTHPPAGEPFGHRRDAACAWDADAGALWVAGGVGDLSKPADLWRWDADGWRRTPIIGRQPALAYECRAAWDAVHERLVALGAPKAGATPRLWELHADGARSFAAPAGLALLAYDPQTSRVIGWRNTEDSTLDHARAELLGYEGRGRWETLASGGGLLEPGAYRYDAAQRTLVVVSRALRGQEHRTAPGQGWRVSSLALGEALTSCKR